MPPVDEVDQKTKKLVEEYISERDWDQVHERVQNTSESVRLFTEAIVDTGEVDTDKFSAIYNLCQHDNTYTPESKAERVEAFDIDESTKARIKRRIHSGTGIIGGGSYVVNVDGYEEEAFEFLQTLVTSESQAKLDKAIREFADLGISGVQAGKISAVLYFLHPETYPVNNKRSREGMAEYFGYEMSSRLVDYLDAVEAFREVRDEFSFETNFRDLDNFFNWVMNGEPQTVTLADVGGGDASAYWVNQQNRSEIIDEYLSAKIDNRHYHDLSRLDEGDVIFHNFDGELIGVSFATGEMDTYTFRGDEYYRPSVELHWVKDPIPVDDELKRDLGTEPPQAEYNPIDKNGDLKVAYLSDLTPEAANLLLDRLGIEELEMRSEVSEGESGETTEAGRIQSVERPAGAEVFERQLRQENQVVLYGPPGTGKTYTAKQFANWWVNEVTEGDPDPSQVRSVTFHPSFAYEDFVEGLTADATDAGQVKYDVEPGILKEIAKAAAKAQTTSDGSSPPYVLIVDEINRGNLAQIFGETITLLEADKRDSYEVQLAHSGDPFTLPSNLYLIGTMNTADQSIALVDTALRRRFRFVDFPPNLDVVFEQRHDSPESAETVISGGAESASPTDKLLAISVRAVERLNEKILNAPQLGKGKQIGHTYLLGHESPTAVVDTWRYDILPQLEEYYFGQFGRLREQLLDQTGERLIDWDAERIREFDEQTLYDALCAVAEVDDAPPLFGSDEEIPSGHAEEARATDE